VIDPFPPLGDPVRRTILELLASGEQPAGAIVDTLNTRSPITQPSVSQHLKVLLDAQLVQVRAQGRHRYYSLDPAGITAAQLWLSHLVDPFRQPLDALETEIARGRRISSRPDSSPQTAGEKTRDRRRA